jgi:adhesin transport system outer membrane protein
MNIRKGFLLVGLALTFPLYADTLYEAVQHGILSNPEVLFNTARGLTAQQQVQRAKGAYLPTVDVTAGFGREYSLNPTTQAIDGPGARTLNRTESGVELRQNLFAGGGIANELKRNIYLCEAQHLKTQGVAEDLALDVVNRYLLVLLSEKLYRYAVTNYQVHRSVFSMIRERSDAGLTREAEMDQAVARLALAEANQISAEANLQEARINYAKVVGKWPSNLVWPRIPKNQELPRNLGQAIEKGLDNHPTVRSAYADIKEAKSQYEVALANFYPRVDLILGASQNRNLDGIPGQNNDRLAMIRMNYNVFRGGSDDAHVRETAYQVQEAYEVKNRALVDLKESIRLSWNAWITAGERIRPLREHVRASRETRGAYQEQFKVGKRTLLDLLDSQNEFYQSEIALVQGENDEAFARYRILNGMGRLVPYLRIKLPVNVANNDIFTSAQNHILLNKAMDKVPYPDNSDQGLLLAHPVRNINKTRLTPAVVNNNTSPPPLVRPKLWFVSVGRFTTKAEAVALENHLRKLGFGTCIELLQNGCFNVIVGPYEYRGHAANAMERLKEVAHVPGILVTYKNLPRHI